MFFLLFCFSLISFQIFQFWWYFPVFDFIFPLLTSIVDEIIVILGNICTFSTETKLFGCFLYLRFVSNYFAWINLYSVAFGTNFVVNYCFLIFHLNFYSIIHTVYFFTIFLFTCLNHRFFIWELRNLPTGRKKVLFTWWRKIFSWIFSWNSTIQIEMNNIPIFYRSFDWKTTFYNENSEKYILLTF